MHIQIVKLCTEQISAPDFTLSFQNLSLPFQTEIDPCPRFYFSWISPLLLFTNCMYYALPTTQICPQIPLRKERKRLDILFVCEMNHTTRS